MLKDHQWFADRIGKTIQVTYANGSKHELRVYNTKQIAWLHSAQDYEFKFADLPTKEPNVCTACEG